MLPTVRKRQCFEALSGLQERIYLLSRQLDENVTNLHLPALRATHDVPILEPAVCMSVKIDVLESIEVSAVSAEMVDSDIIVEEFPVPGTQPLAHCDSKSCVLLRHDRPGQLRGLGRQ